MGCQLVGVGLSIGWWWVVNVLTAGSWMICVVNE